MKKKQLFLFPHSENIISLDVYFQDLNYDEIVQVPKFEIFSLIGKSQ